jgi:outer membrane receptor for ferric coprogen and ferric-rhodotorulic acid
MCAEKQRQQHQQLDPDPNPNPIPSATRTDGETPSPHTYTHHARVAQTRMQLGQYATTRIALSEILRTEGVLGLYRGLGATIALDVVYAFVQV